MNQNKPKSRLLRNIGLALATVAVVNAAHAAPYADTDAVVTAVNGIPATATTAFLAAATLGVAFLIVRMVGRALKRGVSL